MYKPGRLGHAEIGDISRLGKDGGLWFSRNLRRILWIGSGELDRNLRDEIPARAVAKMVGRSTAQ